MSRKCNRFLAFLLTLALITTTFSSDYASTRSFAVGSEEELEQISEDSSEESSELEWEDIETDEETPAENEENESDIEANVETETEVSEETPSDQATEGAVEEATADITNGGNVAEEPATAPATTEATASATEAVEASSEATSANVESTEAASAATSASIEEAADAASSASTEIEEKEQNLVTVTYKASMGGRVSTKEETIDLNDEDAKFEGSEATPWNDKYQFTEWVDEDGNFVTNDALLVPSDVEKDTTFTAKFMKLEEMPAISESKITGGMNVSVEAEEGLFPEGTTVSIEAIPETQALETAQDTLGDNVKEAKGVDIKFIYNEDEIQPADAQYVHVSISLVEKIEGTDFTVLHEHDGEVKEIAADVTTEEKNEDPEDETKVATGVEFDSNEFSVYIVAGKDSDENLTRKVEHYTFEVKNNEGVWEQYGEKQDIKSGEALNNPGIPELASGQSFIGWYIWENDKYSNNPVTFGVPKSEDDIVANKEYIVRARIHTTYSVTFKGENGMVVAVRYPEEDESGNYPCKLDVAVTPSSDTMNFIGWTNLADEFFADGATVDATDANNRTLNAVIKNGFWVHFDENDGGAGGGASYTKPQFVVEGGKATRPEKDPTRNGYKFDGWYVDEECDTLFDFENTEINQTTTVYAGWILDKAFYTVIIWKQNIEDHKDASDEDKTYDYSSSEVLKGDSLSEITDSMLNGATGKNFEGFHYRTYEVVNKDASVEGNKISPKGSTVVNIYYDRNLMTINYHYYRYKDRYGNYNYDGGEVVTFTGLYGQSFNKYNYVYPSDDGFWYLTISQSSYNGPAFLSEFDGWSNPSRITMDLYQSDNNSNNKASFYKQNSDGSWPNSPSNVAYLSGIVPSLHRYDGFSAYQYRVYEVTLFGSHWSDWKNVTDETVNVGYGIEVMHKRNEYNLEIQSVFDPIDPITGEAISIPEGYYNGKVEATYKLLYEAALSGKKDDAIALAKNLAKPKGFEPKQIKREDGTWEVAIWADEGGTKEFDWNQTMPASDDTRAYIVWTKAEYNIKLDLNVDDDCNPETKVGYDAVDLGEPAQSLDFWVVYEDTVSRDSITTKIKRDDYDLVGWFNYDGNIVYDYGPVTENVNLYAKWRRKGEVKIVYNEESQVEVDGEMVTVKGEMLDSNRDTNSYSADSTVIVTSGPINVPAGFSFVGWNLLDSEGNVVNLYYPNGHFDIKDNYIVTTGEGDNRLNQVFLQAKYEKTGAGDPDVLYTFVEYDPNPINSEGTGTATKVTEVTSEEETEPHKIRVNEAFEAWGLAEASAAGFSQPGYRLIGWNIDQNAAKNGIKLIDLNQQYIIADNDSSTDNPSTNKLYAVWEADPEQTYTVTYVADPATMGDVTTTENKDIQVLVTDGVTGSTATAKPGYKFTGWYNGTELASEDAELTAAEAITKLNKEGAVYKNTTFTAKFEEKEDETYTVTYEAGANGKVDPISQTEQVLHDDKITGSEATANAGYKFEGWYLVDGETETKLEEAGAVLTHDVLKPYLKKNETTGIYEDTKFRAKFAEKEDETYTVTYEAGANGKVDPTSQTEQVLHDDKITGSEATANVGYKFEGWYLVDGETETKLEGAGAVLTHDVLKPYLKKNETTGIYENTTFKAKFEYDDSKKYNVTYERNISEAGSLSYYENKDIQALQSDKVTGSVATVNAGYKFNGWYKKDETTPITTELDLTKVLAIQNLNRNADHNELYDDTIYVAEFAENEDETYTVTYEAGANGKVDPTSQTEQVLHDEKITGSKATANAGYKFEGWYLVDGETETKLEGAGAVLTHDVLKPYLKKNETTGIYEDTTFEARFVADEGQTYKAKYVSANTEYGTVNPAEDAEASQVLGTANVKGSTATAKTGYKFTGWYNGTELASEDAELTVAEAIAKLNKEGAVYKNTTFTAHFDVDKGQTKTLSYKVQHSVAGTVQTADTQEYTATVWVNDPDTIEVKTGSLAKKEYTGYKYDSQDPAEVTEKSLVNNGQVITLNYIKDDSVTKTVGYVVQYEIDGVVDANNSKAYSKKVWVNDPDTITVEAGSLEQKTFEGYKFIGQNPANIKEGDEVKNETVITLRYQKDSDQTKDVAYTVNHVVDGTVRDTANYPTKVWVNDPSEIEVTKDSLAAKDYVGYEVQDIEVVGSDVVISEDVVSKVTDGTVINLIYGPRTYTVRYEYRFATDDRPDTLPALPASFEVKYGQEFDVIDVPTIEGYTLTFWSMEEDKENTSVISKMIDAFQKFLDIITGKIKASAAGTTMKAPAYNAVIYTVISANPAPTPTGGDDDTTTDDTPTGGDDTTPVTPAPVAAAPAAAPAAAVLGATREGTAATNGAAVLGSRRAKTDDQTDDTSRAFAIVIAAAVAISLFVTRKKKEEE